MELQERSDKWAGVNVFAGRTSSKGKRTVKERYWRPVKHVYRWQYFFTLSMPRQGRIDAAGALHHIMCRGIERKKIFCDDSDRDDFVSRLGAILVQTSTRCYAWALLPNHGHLLLQTGTVPIATVMRRQLTGIVRRDELAIEELFGCKVLAVAVLGNV